MADLRGQIQALRQQIEELNGDTDPNLQHLAEGTRNFPAMKQPSMRPRRLLRGHFGKIYAMHWAPNSDTFLVSASQDGKLIVWNGFTTNKVVAIPLLTSFVMTCAYSHDGTMVACGGLDNMCTVYKIPFGKDSVVNRNTRTELSAHEGYTSCCRFVDRDSKMMTASGDSTCVLWDVETKTKEVRFKGHASDVMAISVHEPGNIFVSSSCDATSKVWDYRSTKACVRTLRGHESDVTSCDFFPDGNAFATGSDDSSCRMFDIRAYAQVNKYHSDEILTGITSVGFSKSGKILFAGSDDYACHMWDTCSGLKLDSLQGHANRVSCLGVSATGKALCTGSWDTLLKIWA